MGKNAMTMILGRMADGAPELCHVGTDHDLWPEARAMAERDGWGVYVPFDDDRAESKVKALLRKGL